MSYLTVGHGKVDGTDEDLPAEKDFIRALYQFMRDRCTPIERIPSLGFKQIDLFAFFKIVHRLGGYEQIMLKQVWRQVYNKLGGNPHSTSAATCTRKHYEKLILPYERYLRGQEETEESPTKTVKRYNGDMFKDATAEEPEPVVKQVRLESAPWKEMLYSVPCTINRFVMGPVPHIPGYQQLWKQQQQERSMPFPCLKGLLTIPLTMQGAYVLPSEYSNYVLGNQQGSPNRSLIKPRVKQEPMELQRHLAQESTDCDRQDLPLNLSSKRRSSKPSGSQYLQPDPSSTPTCTTPKFLNHVSPLYSSHHIKKIEGPLKSQVHASGSHAEGRVSGVSDIVATSLHPLIPGSQRNENRMIHAKSGKPEPSKSGTQTLLDLTPGQHCMVTPTKRMLTSYSVLKDNDQHSIVKASTQVLPVLASPTTIPSAPGWHIATKSNPYCKVSHMVASPACQKSEPVQKTQSNPIPKGSMNAILHPLKKPTRFIDSLCCADDAMTAVSNQPELKPAVYRKGQEDRGLAVTPIPAFRIGHGDHRISFSESCQVSCSGLSMSPYSLRRSSTSLAALSNTSSHLEQYSTPPHASLSKPTQESRHLGHVFQNTEKIKYRGQDLPAMGSSSLDVNPPRVGRQEDHYHDTKSKELVGFGTRPLQKYLSLESNLKQVSGACFGGRMETRPGHHQGLTLWSPPNHQGEAPGALPQKELLKMQAFTHPIVS